MQDLSLPSGTSGQSMEPGYAYCIRCHADVFPGGERISEGHVAIRFGRDDQRNFTVYEGESRLLHVYEVLAGSEGWVIEVHPEGWAGGCHVCGNPMPLRRVRLGTFRIERARVAA